MNVRRPRAVGVDPLTLAGPGRHRHTDCGEGFTSGISKLEARTYWNRQRGSRSQFDLPSLGPILVPPHLPKALYDIPDLINSSVPQRAGHFAGAEFEVRHAAC